MSVLGFVMGTIAVLFICHRRTDFTFEPFTKEYQCGNYVLLTDPDEKNFCLLEKMPDSKKCRWIVSGERNQQKMQTILYSPDSIAEKKTLLLGTELCIVKELDNQKFSTTCFLGKPFPLGREQMYVDTNGDGIWDLWKIQATSQVFVYQNEHWKEIPDKDGLK